MSSSDDRWVAAELRETLESGDLPALAEAGLLDSDDLDFLISFRNAIDDAEEHEEYQQMLEKAVSGKINESVERGNISVMSHASGIKTNRTDATGYDRLIDACSPAAHQILIKGPKGSGKTTKALDIIRRMVADGVVDKVMTNVEGPDEHDAVEFAEDISRYLEFAKEPGEKVALFDEFSTSGNAYTGQQDVEKVMSRVINAFRKSEGGSLRTMYIGHENDNDIHPLVKKQSDVVLRADGKVDEGLIDKATVYRGWDAYKDDDEWFAVRGLQDVPDSSPWSFSTNYFAHLEWDLDNPEQQIQRGQLIDDWQDYQDDESGGSDGESDENRRVKCRGTNKEGESCGTLTDHESGHCEWHREQWDGDPDPRLQS